jgi:microcystin-dependent protein
MSEAYLGEIRLFAGNYAPQDWALCNGALLNVQNNQALFSVIGKTYGGDGVTNFALPDLRGRIPVGVGQGARLSNNYALGQQGGVENVTLTVAQIPSHQHSLQATTSPATTTDPTGAMLAQTPAEFCAYVTQTSTTVDGPLDPSVIDDAGGGQAHTNIMPSAGITYIICVVGSYPEPPQ